MGSCYKDLAMSHPRIYLVLAMCKAHHLLLHVSLFCREAPQNGEIDFAETFISSVGPLYHNRRLTLDLNRSKEMMRFQRIQR